MIQRGHLHVDYYMMNADEFQLSRERVARYFYWAQLLIILLVGVWFFGVGLVVAIVYALFIGVWLPQRQSEALRYWIDGTTLRVDQGVYFLKRKAIPLDRITDVALVQGPLQRWCGVWALQIQTAGTGGQPMPEAILYGLQAPESIRDELLKARDAAATNSAT